MPGGAPAIAAVAAALALAGCTSFAPWSGDGDEARAPTPTEHVPAEIEAPERALDVAVLDPADYERGIRRRKEALAGTIDEPAADTGYYLDVQEAQLRRALNGTDTALIRDDPHIRLLISGTDAFETGSAELNPAVRQTLATVAEVLEDYRLTLVVVHGHTDAAGDADDNQRLSEARAVVVAHGLVDSGLTADRIMTIGHGESRPLDHDTSPESRWPDRRIEIRLELIAR